MTEIEFPAEQTKPLESAGKKETEKTFNFGFYVTDHSPDFADTGDPVRLRELYSDIERDGIESIRFDWRWKNIEPIQGQIDNEQAARYSSAVSTMKEVGLNEPTVVLSSIPDWAKKLYKEDKNKFFDAYGQYLQQVKTGLQSVEGSRVSTFQVLNELNNPLYTPIEDPQDLIRMCQMTRETFADYNPDLKIMVSVLATNIPKVSIRTFLPKLEQIKDAVDVIAIDYYPGGWYRPISEGNKLKDLAGKMILPGKKAYKKMFSDMSLFGEVAQRVAALGKDYELGETGFPVKGIYWGNESRQRYFYDAFFRNFKHLMVDFRQRGIKLPDRIGLYQAINEWPRDLKGKILRKTPYPEFNWGMRGDKGERRSILRGNPHTGELYDGQSRLAKIIHYMRAPIRKAT